MSIIRPSVAFKSGADWVSGDVQAFIKQLAIHVDTVADVNDNDFETWGWIYVKATSGLYRYAPASAATDDGDTVLQDNIGRRYVKVAATAIAAWADAHVADITSRGAYDGEAEGFVVLVDDTGAGRAAFYTMGDGGSADWQGPAYLTGTAGAAGAAGSAGADGDITWQGAWVTATGYTANQAVSEGGSSYVCIEAHTSGVFATDLAAVKWELLAAKGETGATGAAGETGPAGADGDGAGDMVFANVVLDEDDMASDSATKVPTQQSVKAYVDAHSGGGGGREVLTANRTYYVRTDGSDSNNGLTDTSGGAFATCAKAIATIYETIDCAGNAVVIQLNDGTHTAPAAFTGMPLNCAGVYLWGNLTTPSNVILSVTSDNAVETLDGAVLNVDGMEIRTTSAGDGVYAGRHSIVRLGGSAAVNFGACASDHIQATEESIVYHLRSYTISGGAGSHWHVNVGGRVIVNSSITITLSGTPAFSNYFAGINQGSLACDLATFSGSATGQRFLVHRGASITRGTNNLADLPGSTRGVARTGGFYDDYTGDRWLAIERGQTAIVHTGTTATTTLATKTVKAGWMGPNGRIRVTSIWSATNNGNAKTIQVRAATINLSAPSIASSSSFRDSREFFNANDVAVQVGGTSAGSTGGFGANTSAHMSATINTDSSFDIDFRVALTDSADTVTLLGYVIELLGSD